MTSVVRSVTTSALGSTTSAMSLDGLNAESEIGFLAPERCEVGMLGSGATEVDDTPRSVAVRIVVWSCNMSACSSTRPDRSPKLVATSCSMRPHVESQMVRTSAENWDRCDRGPLAPQLALRVLANWTPLPLRPPQPPLLHPGALWIRGGSDPTGRALGVAIASRYRDRSRLRFPEQRCAHQLRGLQLWRRAARDHVRKHHLRWRPQQVMKTRSSALGCLALLRHGQRHRRGQRLSRQQAGADRALLYEHGQEGLGRLARGSGMT